MKLTSNLAIDNCGNVVQITHTLTFRNLDILSLKLRGCTVSEAARVLGIGVNTAQGQWNDVKSAVGARSEREVFAWAARAGLVTYSDKLPSFDIEGKVGY